MLQQDQFQFFNVLQTNQQEFFKLFHLKTVLTVMIRGEVLKSVDIIDIRQTMCNVCVKNVKDTLHTCSIHNGTLPTLQGTVVNGVFFWSFC